MNIFSQGYNALLGEKGQTQTIGDTVDKLVDRLKHSSSLEDRRVAALGLRRLCREYQLVISPLFSLVSVLKTNAIISYITIGGWNKGPFFICQYTQVTGYG